MKREHTLARLPSVLCPFFADSSMDIIIRRMVDHDIPFVAEVHRQSFTRQRESLRWIKCNYHAAPRIQYYVAMIDSSVVGYIQWIQKSGFRPEVVLELEQIAVLPDVRGKGIGHTLIDESLLLVREQLQKDNSTLKHIMVTTRSDNFAQKLYNKTFGARVECTIRDLFSADEVIMIARNVE